MVSPLFDMTYDISDCPVPLRSTASKTSSPGTRTPGSAEALYEWATIWTEHAKDSSLSGTPFHLIRPQRNHRMDPRCSPGGNIPRDRCHAGQQRPHGEKRDRIAGR